MLRKFYRDNISVSFFPLKLPVFEIYTIVDDGLLRWGGEQTAQVYYLILIFELPMKSLITCKH
jgi:hypothetical protein